MPERFEVVFTMQGAIQVLCFIYSQSDSTTSNYTVSQKSSHLYTFLTLSNFNKIFALLEKV